MRPSRRWIPKALAAALALGCRAAEPTNDTRHAALVQTCAPWDGAAIALFLTDAEPGPGYPAAPYSSITIYKTLPELEGKRFTVTADTPELGSGQDCPAGGLCTQAPGATIAFGTLAADSTIVVSYSLDLGGGRVLRGEARPRLYPQHGFCG